MYNEAMSTQGRSSRTIFALSGWILAVVIIAIGIAGYSLGYVTLTMPGGGESMSSCSDESREAFYAAYNTSDRSKDTLSELHAQVVADESSADDPNCVYVDVLYQTYIVRDKSAAEETLATLKSLAEEGLYPDSRYENVLQYSIIQRSIDTLGSDEAGGGIG